MSAWGAPGWRQTGRPQGAQRRQRAQRVLQRAAARSSWARSNWRGGQVGGGQAEVRRMGGTTDGSTALVMRSSRCRAHMGVCVVMSTDTFAFECTGTSGWTNRSLVIAAYIHLVLGTDSSHDDH